MTAGRPAGRTNGGGRRLDPITLSVLTSALSGVAEEMGTALVRSAYSSNIKERRDCSAAMFDARGRMVAQAEHIRCTWGRCPRRWPRSWSATQGPATCSCSTTHSPAATTCPTSRWCPGWAPTSRPGVTRSPGRTTRTSAGCSRGRCRPALATSGRRVWSSRRYDSCVPATTSPDVLELILANTRTPRLRRGDFQAQIAANRLAQDRLADLISRWGDASVFAAFDEVLAYAQRRTREVVRKLPDGQYVASSQIEGDGVTNDDIPIRVAVRVAGIASWWTSPAPPGRGRRQRQLPLEVTRSACFLAAAGAFARRHPGQLRHV